MASKNHGRQYDLVVFGATGYTGTYTAQYITAHLPSTLKWAIAGRSSSKLTSLIADLTKLDPDRAPPSIEICSLDSASLASLAKKTFILLTTVGPYGALGEHAFSACAAAGTHYLDVTGEVPFVFKMINKYAATAAKTGALMFPQIGIESAPPDLLTWSLATHNREVLSLPTADVTVSVHTLKSAPSGGTLATVFTILDNFSLAELRASHVPYALSPVPRPASSSPPKPSLWTRLTGLVTVPPLGLLTTSLAGSTDAAQVQRTWGLLASVPSRKAQAYGPRFSFKEYMRPRNWLTGVGIHLGLMVLGLVMATPFLRRLIAKRVYQPGEGPEAETAKWDEIEYRGVGRADGDGGEKGSVGRAWFLGSTYYLTGILLAEAAATLLQEDVDLPGGVYTPACLGQPFIDRLDRAGFHIEVKSLEP